MRLLAPPLLLLLLHRRQAKHRFALLAGKDKLPHVRTPPFVEAAAEAAGAWVPRDPGIAVPIDPLVGRDVGPDPAELLGEEEEEAKGGGQGEEGLEEEGQDGAEAEGPEDLAGVFERGGQRHGDGFAEAWAEEGGEVKGEGEEVEHEEEEEAAVVLPTDTVGDPHAVVVVPVDVDATVRAVLVCMGGSSVVFWSVHE
jgi:hypothetical protein